MIHYGIEVKEHGVWTLLPSLFGPGYEIEELERFADKLAQKVPVHIVTVEVVKREVITVVWSSEDAPEADDPAEISSQS